MPANALERFGFALTPRASVPPWFVDVHMVHRIAAQPSIVVCHTMHLDGCSPSPSPCMLTQCHGTGPCSFFWPASQASVDPDGGCKLPCNNPPPALPACQPRARSSSSNYHLSRHLPARPHAPAALPLHLHAAAPVASGRAGPAAHRAAAACGGGPWPTSHVQRLTTQTVPGTWRPCDPRWPRTVTTPTGTTTSRSSTTLWRATRSLCGSGSSAGAPLEASCYASGPSRGRRGRPRR